jgi:1-acyl-sn-glycerol-3-phosphate acyltransferase
MSLTAQIRRGITSVLVWTLGFAWMTVVILFLIGYGLVRGGGPQLNRWAARLMAPVTNLAYSRFRVIYDPGFDPTRASVFCQNHVNFMDAHVACRVIPGPFCGLMLASHFKIPAYGWIMRITNGIPVPSGRGGRTAALMTAASDRISRGMSILVFPEAHRTRDGHVQPFKHGVFFMARDAGAPVVPIAVHGAYEVNHKGTWLFTRGPVTVWIGPQVETEGLDDEALAVVIAELQADIGKFVDTGIVPDRLDRS